MINERKRNGTGAKEEREARLTMGQSINRRVANKSFLLEIGGELCTKEG